MEGWRVYGEVLVFVFEVENGVVFLEEFVLEPVEVFLEDFLFHVGPADLVHVVFTLGNGSEEGVPSK